jgi:Holliday junction resolvase RusA-like endonuclease
LRVKEWRKAIREAAQDAGWRPWPLDVGVILEVHLHLPRPAHPSRPYPVRPDVDNGWKAVADALQACARKALHGLAVVDDSQVCEGRCSKWWAGERGPGAVVVARPIDQEWIKEREEE